MAQAIKFYKGSLPTSRTKGTVYFDTESKTIKVATSASLLEEYGGTPPLLIYLSDTFDSTTARRAIAIEAANWQEVVSKCVYKADLLIDQSDIASYGMVRTIAFSFDTDYYTAQADNVYWQSDTVSGSVYLCCNSDEAWEDLANPPASDIYYFYATCETLYLIRQTVSTSTIASVKSHRGKLPEGAVLYASDNTAIRYFKRGNILYQEDMNISTV